MNVLGDDRTCQMIFYILTLHHLDMQVNMNTNKPLVLQGIDYFNYKLKQIKIWALRTILGLKYTSMHFLAKRPEEFLLFMKIKLLTCHFYCSKLHSVLTVRQTDTIFKFLPSGVIVRMRTLHGLCQCVTTVKASQFIHQKCMCVCVC